MAETTPSLLTMAKVRTFAGACITRYNAGERSMSDVVAYYKQNEEMTTMIKAEILKRVPTMDFDEVTEE